MGPIEQMPQWQQMAICSGLFGLLMWLYTLPPSKWQQQAQAREADADDRLIQLAWQRLARRLQAQLQVTQSVAPSADTTQPPAWWSELQWDDAARNNEEGR